MATLAQVFDQIFCNKELFVQYMAAVAQHQEVEFLARLGCKVTQSEWEAYQRQRQAPPQKYCPAPKPLDQCPPFSPQEFFSHLPADGTFARQPGEEEQILHFID